MVAEFEQANERPEVCPQHDLRLCSFRLWLNKVRSEGGEHADSSRAFVPVVAAKMPCSGADGSCPWKFEAIDIVSAGRPSAGFMSAIVRSMTTRQVMLDCQEHG